MESLYLIFWLIFWGSFLVVFWTYFGYLVTLKLISLVGTRKVDSQDHSPPVTMVVTAHNEARRIREKIDNSLSLIYPEGKLEIVIVSDGSTDGTDAIVEEFEGKGIKLLRIPKRQGKHYGQKRGIELSQTEIIVFTDATTFLEKDAIEKIVRSFADPTIGVVSGEDKIPDDLNNHSGEGAYVRYEMKLRALEAQVGSLVGASGCFFAIRKHLADTWVDNMSSDFFMPIVAYMNGFRTVPDTEAIGYYSVLSDPDREFERKVRTVLHGLEVLFQFKGILNPFRYGIYSIQMISHKLMRWLVPFTLPLMLYCSAALSTISLFFNIVLFFQVVFYSAAAIGMAVKPLRSRTLFKVPFFFVMVNFSIVIAWFNYITGKKQVVWEATKR